MRSIFYVFGITALLVIINTSCEKDDTGPNLSSEFDFIALHLENGTLEQPYFSLMRIRDGEPEFTHLSDVYPFDFDSSPQNHESRWKSRLHQGSGKLGMILPRGLSEQITNQFGEELTVWTGAWMNMPEGSTNELPLLNPCTDFGYDADCSRYSYTRRHSVRIGKCGNVFYLASSSYKAGGWHEEPRYRLVKYNPGSGDYKISPLISDWTLSQPEINPDTYGLAGISEEIYPSSCGRYVYGRTQAWGISGGTLISSRGIMFRYDFENGEFSRVENVGYGFNPMFVTRDDRYVVYRDASDGNQNKMVDLQSGQVRQLETTFGPSHQTGTNNFGILGTAYPLREFRYYNAVNDEMIRVPVPDHITSLQFSADGTFAYFRYRLGDKNYLLRTSDLTENATVDTVAVLPDNVRVMTLLP